MAEAISSSVDEKSSRAGTATARRSALLLLMVAAVALVVSIRSVTWDRIAQLEREFAAIESERFLLGIHARESAAQMNAALLRYQLSSDPDEREAFLAKAGSLKERLARTIPMLETDAERAAAADFKIACEQYLNDTAEMLEKPVRGVRKDTAAQVHDLIQEKSRVLKDTAARLVVAQADAWIRFVSKSRDALASLQRMLWISLLALLLFSSLVTMLLYRLTVTPLRAQLSLSEKTIERHEKLASLGTLAAGVAHEIRNPLQAIKMRLFSFKRTLPSAVRDHEDLTVISSEINRLEKIVRETLEFARPPNPELGTVSAAELISSATELLRRAAPPGIALQVEPDDSNHGRLMFRGDRQQIQQVLINLVQNGMESIEGEGTVTLRARGGLGFLGRDRIPVVLLEVSDTGRGIQAAAEQRIFDPFFSTKDGGTGLGLSIAARIVEAHGGTIQYSTQPGRGTTFTIMLPRLTDERAHPAH